MILRPYGVVISGHLELGVELVMDGSRIDQIRPHTGLPEPFVISPAFVNAHSHLEYRGLMGKIDEPDYWPWIREITRLKPLQDLAEVRADTMLAARENRQAGVAQIAEHSHRPFSGEAMAAAGLGGVIFQEVITSDAPSREERLREIDEAARHNGAHFDGPVARAPHAYYTVDRQTLLEIAGSGEPFSIHVAETEAESELTLRSEGLIAEYWRMHGRTYEPTGLSIFGTLDALGLARPGAQYVHCCDLDPEEIPRLAVAGVTVAHCPRSNVRLRCPSTPVRDLLDAGVKVGLGLDSAASSGPIDMFAEMRSALEVAEERGRPIHPEEAWQMATTMGHDSILPALGPQTESWEIEEGSAVPLIKIGIPGALHTEDLISSGSPRAVEWVER